MRQKMNQSPDGYHWTMILDHYPVLSSSRVFWRVFGFARWCLKGGVCLVSGLYFCVAVASTGPALVQLAQLHADSVVDVQSLLVLAESGDARASFLLGSRYASGRGGFRDDSEAVRWFTIAAEKGLGEAQYNLGVMIGAGRGANRDIYQAARWFRLAAEQEVAEAQFNLGTLYSLGQGVPKDMAAAAEWLRKAAGHRLPGAKYNLGVLYEHGQGVRLDGRAALVWYKRAADQGYEPAKERLAMLMSRLQVDEVTDQPSLPTTEVESATNAITKPTVASSVPKAHTKASPEAEPKAGVLVASDQDASSYLAWLDRLAPDLYTLQVLSDTSESGVQRYLERYYEPTGQPMAYFASKKNGQIWFSVIYGLYADYKSAKAAIPGLPEFIRKAKPWVRRVVALRNSALR